MHVNAKVDIAMGHIITENNNLGHFNQFQTRYYDAMMDGADIAELKTDLYGTMAEYYKSKLAHNDVEANYQLVLIGNPEQSHNLMFDHAGINMKVQENPPKWIAIEKFPGESLKIYKRNPEYARTVEALHPSTNTTVINLKDISLYHRLIINSIE